MVEMNNSAGELIVDVAESRNKSTGARLQQPWVQRPSLTLGRCLV